MKQLRGKVALLLNLCLMSAAFATQNVQTDTAEVLTVKAGKEDKQVTGGKRKTGSGKDDWTQQEYSGEHSEKNIRMALGSKAFSWLSGSPADNEKLSVGKTAQFFGFVALRYQSGRAAKRGSLGRGFERIATPDQRALLKEAVVEESPVMAEWWQARSQLMRLLENHLYTGEPLDGGEIIRIGELFGFLNAASALIEARAFADLERSLSDEQLQELHVWRKDPSIATMNDTPRPEVGLSTEQSAQYEDLFAKALTLITGSLADRQIVPLGQPAQFFGFVSIRHKSGHGASRGSISKQFYGLLNTSQRSALEEATTALIPLTHEFMAVRTQLLQEMDKLRQFSIDKGETFDQERFDELARELGVIEARCAMVEAAAYRKVRASMSPEQVASLMEIRGDYMLDKGKMDELTTAQRGEKLYVLCQGCHESPIAPPLTGIVGRNVASYPMYNYSTAMRSRADQRWSSERLNTFLASPKKSMVGTKMEFSGLLRDDDRQALIEHLRSL